jgi:hypothetical protein
VVVHPTLALVVGLPPVLELARGLAVVAAVAGRHGCILLPVNFVNFVYHVYHHSKRVYVHLLLFTTVINVFALTTKTENVYFLFTCLFV